MYMVFGCCVPKCRYSHIPCDNCDNHMENKAIRQKFNLQRINKQVRQDSSLAIMKRRVGVVNKVVGQSANPGHLGQAGGPGDLTSSIQKCGGNEGLTTYRMFTKYARVQNKEHSGVDKKHGSYARYLARRVGGELRKEKLPNVVKRTAVIKQPRSRTGFSCGVNSSSNVSNATTSDKSGIYKCCDNRIPTRNAYSNGTRGMGSLSGFYGSNHQLGSQGGRCAYCPR